MSKVTIQREIQLPDPIRLERCRRAPELGPRVLFFSGGTALRDTARELTAYTHNSIHVITPFDSGGSSALLRKAFAMPAVGDVRNRLMAMADQTLHGNPAIFELFAHRLPKDWDQDALRGELAALASGKHKLVRSIPDPMRKIVRNHLHHFQERMPTDFDLRGASIGNLVLTAGYLDNRRHLDPVIYIFSKLVEVRGTVRPVVSTDMHLAAKLDNGSVVVGQHLLTGKEAAPLASPIKRMWLTRTLDSTEPERPPLRKKMEARIREAELICYPIGSFYSSLVANLLPSGVGRTVHTVACPKVYIPNTGHDPEALGHDLPLQVDRLLDYLSRDFTEQGEPAPASGLLDVILLDASHDYPGLKRLEAAPPPGVAIVKCPLVSPESAPYIDASLLAPVLVSLC